MQDPAHVCCGRTLARLPFPTIQRLETHARVFSIRGVSRNPLRPPGPLLPRLTNRSSAGRPVRRCH